MIDITCSLQGLQDQFQRGVERRHLYCIHIDKGDAFHYVVVIAVVLVKYKARDKS